MHSIDSINKEGKTYVSTDPNAYDKYGVYVGLKNKGEVENLH